MCAWQEFQKGKTKKEDVVEFKRQLMNNIFSLHNDLKNKTYKHGAYEHFVVNDPKKRDIHKASVRDRLLHHAIYRKLYPFFDKTFIADSYSCRNNKGTHRAMKRFDVFARKESKNYTKTVWVLKCDIRKFFASINHNILINILKRKIEDEDILWLLKNVIGSFDSGGVIPAHAGIQGQNLDSRMRGNDKNKVGLPLGNLTSQLLVNIYMNEFDQYVKHKMKIKYYIRYADDFVVMSRDRKCLECVCKKIEDFFTQELKLSLHPDKVFIKTIASGVDFLGWVHFEKHKTLRTVTKRRMFRKVSEKNVASYLGLLSHGNGFKLSNNLQFLHTKLNSFLTSNV